MSSRIRTVCIATAVAAGLCGVGLAVTGARAGAASDATAGKGVVRIALVSVISGPYAKAGEDLIHSATLAIADANASGGIRGKKMEGVVQDDAGDPQQAVTVAQRLCQDKSIVAVLSAETSTAAIPAARVYAKCGLTMLRTTDDPRSAEAGLRNVFHLVGRTDDEAVAWAAYLTKTVRAKRVYIIDDQSAATSFIAHALESSLKKRGISVEHDVYTGGGNRVPDMAPYVTRAKAFSPDAIYMAINVASEGALFIKAAKSAGLTSLFFGGGNGLFDVNDYVDGAPKETQGSYITFFSPDLRRLKTAQHYLRSFSKHYGKLGGFGPSAYEGAALIAHQLRTIRGTVTRASALNAVRATRGYVGIFGAPISWDSRGDLKGGGVWLYAVKGGKFVEVKKLGLR